jgi:HTH-type transcriptional regulator/antitoxin HigA
VPEILAKAGIRFVIVESLPSAKIDGVCFWLADNAPVIALTLRFNRIDNFWFVLRHEIEHVLNKDGQDGNPVIDTELEGKNLGTDNSLPKEERLANAAAADFCVPSEKMDSFIARKKPFYYEKDVAAFAKLMNRHIGIVVGQMQFRMDRYDYLKRHLVKIRQFVLPGAIADGWGQTVPIN